ncbi:DUF1697 domain-containing protein [Adhaeribacter sp. BT258]|uniref:DUF1697 domain-containing protein n=1 Tax=Adhaeribacter terrigena TaxID=2793070 RepID=A0ABS1C4B5_9BACT|nr:DUF1697 domain-containing protein [Adhaeribacter terrigena]MBK0403473.1 DUF1697 domain-containing protein [Adhaeribacter terrigena]
MQTYTALLRGINVSGHKKIKMPELKTMFKTLGFTNVRTYIQSGNVVFESATAADLESKISAKIQEVFGFEVPVICRTAAEMEQVIARNPYAEMVGFEPEKLYVTFLQETPSEEKLEALKAFSFEPEMYSVSGKEIFVYCFNGYGNTKLENAFFEKKLKVAASTRNWRTINKLIEMSQPATA